MKSRWPEREHHFHFLPSWICEISADHLVAGLAICTLFCEDSFDLVEREEKIPVRLRPVALHAGQEIDLVVGLPVRRELLKFPFAVADVRWIFGAPTAALLHDREASQIAFDEAPVVVREGNALRIELRPVFNDRYHAAVRNRLAVAQGLDRSRGRVVLAKLRRVLQPHCRWRRP